MAEPFIIEVTRGSRVESLHRGAVAVVDASGRSVYARGDVARPVFPRSAVKVFQAIPLIESGAADALGFDEADLSLACASHSGEAAHADRAASMLGKAGLTGEALECGCHWPFDQKIAIAMARGGGQPTALHNNCSGKHAGFLCSAVHLGEETRGYVRAEHPVQRRVRAVFEDLAGIALPAELCGIDGCAIPTYAAPLEAFALGFARLAGGTGVTADRAAAGRRLIAACIAEPWFMSGTGRACRRLIEAGDGRVFVKTGAEGVFCGALPDQGIGFALKIEDGATRAAEAAVAATLSAILAKGDPALSERYAALARTPLRNWNGDHVGEVRPAGF